VNFINEELIKLSLEIFEVWITCASISVSVPQCPVQSFYLPHSSENTKSALSWFA
jgi:hypothetical protein